MTEDFITIAGLAKRFGDVTAVDHVDLNVERGHTFALLGPSGCGKTTLLRLIAGFERADSGLIRIGGREVEGHGRRLPPEKRRVGMVFQDYALFPHMSVAGNVAFGVRGRNSKQRTEHLLDIVGLGGLGSRMPHELSGGQQQRVALARSLAAEPEVILLDEPFSSLDTGLRQRVRAEVRQILETLNMTAIFVTHDQEEALSIARRVGVMIEGRIEQAGSPAAVYHRPASRAVAEFLGDANFLAGEASGGAVQTALGRIEAPGATSGRVEVLVRPEDLALSPEHGEPVEIVQCEYYGHDQMVTVRLRDGSLMKVRQMSAGEFARGQRAALRVSGHVVVLPANGR